MVKLYEKGIYLVNGTEIVEDGQDAAAVLASKTGNAPQRKRLPEAPWHIYSRGTQHIRKHGEAEDQI